MASANYIEECKNPAYKNRLARVQIGEDLVYLTVKEDLTISDGLTISSSAINYDKGTGYLSEVSYSDMCYSNGSIVGTAIAKESSVTVLDVRDFTDIYFIPEIGVKFDTGETEYTSIGKYMFSSQTIDKTANTSKITGYDDFYKLDNTYVCGIEDWTDITVKDVLEDLCNSLELELGTTEFINSDISVSGDKYQKNYTNRDVLSDICELACSWGEIGEDYKLYLKWFEDTIVDTLDKSQYTTLERNGTYGELNCLVIKDSAFEGENVTIQDDESIEVNGETQFVIADNNFLDTEELRNQAITGIWERIQGFSYIDCKIITYYGKPFLRRGDKISVEDDDGTYFETYVLKHTFKFDGTFYSEIEAPSLSSEETVIKNTNLSLKQRVLNAEAQVLKDEATISLVVEKQEEITSTLDENYYTKTTLNELIEDTVSGLINQYTVGGGNNIFRNTGLYFTSNDYDSGYEYWTGLIERQTNINSISGTSMLLQNGSVEQSQEVTNDTYTIAFKYKRLNDLATATVVINDVEYELDSSGAFTNTLEIVANEVSIKFNCDTDNGYEIYELMMNYGEVALTYSQNANEVKTDTVEISEGIKITSDTTDSVFKANADGIRIETKSGNTTTEFLDSGTKTTNLEADKGIIANLLIEEIDGQVWLVGLGR